MSRRLNLPDSASIANATEGEKLHAPSAERNRESIADLLAEIAPETGRALEIASGTGQHVVYNAARLPGLTWQPSDVDPARIASIRAWADEANLPNLNAPVLLDATEPGWAKDHTGYDLIMVVNLLHLISEAEAQTLIREAGRALKTGGQLVIYGPFLRGGELTSDGDANFHASLTAQDPEIGYKDDFDVIDWADNAGMDAALVVEMPANNLSLVFRRAI